ncbi:MAG: hypothetical protein C7B43_20745 [Sulfobacillus benefaciens]|uniref:Uncharacterized protein n=1 Tax=Sulfobacillus benefaciens TaxID=453960 RepID=A0A2T2WJJ3_9FIRM|nr:MAG: hypothetical protein C7B43_20745 [Sulfobacillus benefaciens]
MTKMVCIWWPKAIMMAMLGGELFLAGLSLLVAGLFELGRFVKAHLTQHKPLAPPSDPLKDWQEENHLK